MSSPRPSSPVPGAGAESPAISRACPVKLKAGKRDTVARRLRDGQKARCTPTSRHVSCAPGVRFDRRLSADETSISFTVDASYVGKTYINVEVFDGRKAFDSATSASLTLPIQVRPPEPPADDHTVVIRWPRAKTTVICRSWSRIPFSRPPRSPRVSDIPPVSQFP